MKQSIFNICNLYALLWFIMNIKFIAYESDIISVVAYIFIVAISLYYAAKCYIAKNNPSFVKTYNILFAVLCIYGLFNLFVADVNTTYKHLPADFYLQNIVKSMLPFYAFFAFAKRGMIDRKWLIGFSIIFLVLTIGQYFIKEQSLLWEVDETQGGVTNNIGYIFVSLLPLVCFYKHKVLQYLFLGICAVFTVLSMKRGAIITSAFLLLYFIWESTRVTGKNRWLTILLSIVFIIAGYMFIMQLLNTNYYFVRRIDDTMSGYSSSRDILYTYYWNLYWNDSSLFEYLIGRGADGTIHTGHNYAHNDWLEILINQGLFGIVLFISFWASLFMSWKKCSQRNYIKIALGMCIISLFSKTFFSMSINEMTIYSTCLLGVLTVACSNKEYMAKLLE